MANTINQPGEWKKSQWDTIYQRLMEKKLAERELENCNEEMVTDEWPST